MRARGRRRELEGRRRVVDVDRCACREGGDEASTSSHSNRPSPAAAPLQSLRLTPHFTSPFSLPARSHQGRRLACALQCVIPSAGVVRGVDPFRPDPPVSPSFPLNVLSADGDDSRTLAAPAATTPAHRSATSKQRRTCHATVSRLAHRLLRQRAPSDPPAGRLFQSPAPVAAQLVSVRHRTRR